MLRALDAIAAEHPGRRVAVVSHAGAINAALGAIAGTAHDFLFPLANASVSVVRIGGGRRLLMSANETAHLHPAVARSAG
jgi:broad specificity phosphatase PhoE